MERVWQLQDAKNRFSEVINKAIHEGPQVVTAGAKKSPWSYRRRTITACASPI